MEYLVVDLETSIHNAGRESIGNDRASPYHPDNKIIYMGWCDKSGKVHTTDTYFKVKDIFEGTDLMVGQNIKFDLLYLKRFNKGFNDWLRKGQIWDIQLAEYLLSGQEYTMQSLDNMCERYGLALKNNKVKEYWNAGISTEDIPKAEILPYLEHDVSVTHTIFKAQVVKAKELNMLGLITSQMEGLLSTVEMEYNGMYFNTGEASSDTGKYVSWIKMLEQTIHEEMEALVSEDFRMSPEYNPLSTKQLGKVLFGGEISYSKRVTVFNEDGTPYLYKSGVKKGQMKTKITKVKEKCMGIYPFPGEYTPTGEYKVDEVCLSKLESTSNLAASVLKHRKYSKILNTYLTPYIALTWHDLCIHPKYNHTVTKTGRLSSSSPNLQNVSSQEDI